MERRQRNTLFSVAAFVHLIVVGSFLMVTDLGMAVWILLLVLLAAFAWSRKRDHDRQGGVVGRRTQELLVIYAAVVGASIVIVIVGIVSKAPSPPGLPLPP